MLTTLSVPGTRAAAAAAITPAAAGSRAGPRRAGDRSARLVVRPRAPLRLDARRSPAVANVISVSSSAVSRSAHVRARSCLICSGRRSELPRISSACGPSGCRQRYCVGAA